MCAKNASESEIKHEYFSIKIYSITKKRGRNDKRKIVGEKTNKNRWKKEKLIIFQAKLRQQFPNQ